MYNISLLVGLKNNIDYSKNFYKTTRELYPNVEICFVSYGSTDGTHEWLDSLNDFNLKYFYSREQKTFSDTFNKATELATKDYVAYLHNDIVLAPGFLENLEKHLDPNNVVSYTTIEPPVFSAHERPGKIIYDLGTDLNHFNKEKLYSFVKEKEEEYKDKVEDGITFFMCLSRKVLLEMGGMDNLFNPMFCEDDDLILRLKLKGLNLFTSLDAMCYHFVSKTSRFSEEYKTKTSHIEQQSNRNFVRKWGFRQSIHNKKYDIGFVINNCNFNLLSIYEPWCSNIYIKDDMNLGSHYIDLEQQHTKFNLKDRIKLIGHDVPNNDIVVEFDAILMNQDAFNIIMQMSDIITESGEIGNFKLDIFDIKIKAMATFEHNLIHIYNK